MGIRKLTAKRRENIARDDLVEPNTQPWSNVIVEYLSAIYDRALPFAAAVLTAGPVVWFATEFIARPIRNFFDLRLRVRQLMLSLWDAPSFGQHDPDVELIDLMAPLKEKRDSLLAIGVELSALAQAEGSALFWLRTLGYDPYNAGKSARRLALELGTNIEDRDANYKELDKALKFKFNAKRTFYDPYDAGR